MATLGYVGAAQAAANDLVTEGYVASVGSSGVTQSTVNTMITNGLSSYVTKSYVDTQDGLNATPAFVDAGDATRLHLAQLGANSGVAGLLSTGKVEVARVPIASTQRWPKPFISPAAYHTSAVTTSTAESQLYPVSVADPGFTYKLLVTGLIDASSAVDGQYPIVRVRQGSTTGQLVALGNGLGETYIVGGAPTQYTTAGTHTYTIPGGYTTLDIVVVGGGGGTGLTGGSDAQAWSGQGGTMSSTTVTISALTGSPTTLTATVGAPGDTTGSAGGTSQVVNGGTTLVTAAGGSGNQYVAASATGTTPASITLNNQVYAGGAPTNAAHSGVANAPGGGGQGITTVAAGAAGAVWFFAYNTTTPATGPVRILPYPLNIQASLTGATTLYAMLVSSGTGSVTASTLRPSLMAIPIPA